MLQEHFPINFSHKVGALLLPPGWDVSLLVMGSIPKPRSREKWSKVCGKRKHQIVFYPMRKLIWSLFTHQLTTGKKWLPLPQPRCTVLFSARVLRWSWWTTTCLFIRIVIYSHQQHPHTKLNEPKCIRCGRIGQRLCESVNQERIIVHCCGEEGGVRTACEGSELTLTRTG